MPQITTGSKFNSDRTGICRFDVLAIIAGPSTDGGVEPYAELLSYTPPAPLGLPLVNRSASKEDNGDWLLTCSFEGAPAGSALESVAEIDDSSVDAPIETFPKFRELRKKYGGLMDGNNFAGFPPTLKVGGQNEPNPVYGLSHYLSGNVVLRVTFNLLEYDGSLLRNLRKIDKPRLPKGAERLGETSDGMDWLKKSVKVQFKGNVWQFTMEWMQGHWVPDIYSPRA